jgi:hypothetical protein
MPDLSEDALVHLEGQLVDDDRGAGAAVVILEVSPGADHDPASSGAIAVANAIDAINDAGGRKIRRRNQLDQLVHARFGPAQQQQTSFDHLAQIVRRDVGGHADSDTRAAIDQQIGNARRQKQRLAFGAIVVGAEIDSVLVDVGQQLMRDLGQPDLGVAHCCSVVAIDRAEIALAVDQQVAQRKILRHPDDGVVDRLVAVRMVFTDDIADDTGGLLVGPIPVVVEFVHGKQHSPVDRLESVTHIRQGPTDDHAHRVIEVGAPHFLFEADRQGFFCELIHEEGGAFSGKSLNFNPIWASVL